MLFLSAKLKGFSIFVAVVREKLSGKEDSTIPVLEYDPAQILVRELNQSFQNIAKFYYDKYGGSVIGVKVNKVNIA